MPLRLDPRPAPPLWAAIATPALAMALTVASGWLLFLGLGLEPGPTLYHFLVAPLTSSYGLSELCVKGGPLILIATGLALGFRANVWNIGAEGQLVMGAVCSGGVALALWGHEGLWILPLMGVAGMAGGMAWAAIPAFLKTRFEVSEILSSLMLSYVASFVLGMLVYGPWRDPAGFNFPESRMFTDSAMLPQLLEGTRLHLGLVVTLVVALAAWLLLSRTMLGFALDVSGRAPAAARFAGFSRAGTIWTGLLCSGALAGLAGTFEIAGPIGQLVPQITPGYGFTAIIVAFLGRLHPLGIVGAGFLMALSYNGGEIAQVEDGLPHAAVGVFQGMLLFYLLACDILGRYRIHFDFGASRGEER